MDAQVEKLKEYMDASKYTVVVTGSGISYMYGMTRLKSRNNQMDRTRKTTSEYVYNHPEEFYQMMKDSFLDATFEMGPGPVHKQLAELEKKGLVQGIVTQNMDCLHTISGSTNVAEIMGSFEDNRCLGCGERYHDYTVWGHGKAPRCPKCGAPLMPSCFDRESPTHNADSREVMAMAQDMIAKADLVIIIGTTGFRSDEYLAKLRSSTKLVQINPGSTVFDSVVDLNIRMDAAKVFDEILAVE